MSEEFVDTMVAAGAAFGWIFQYIPIGRDPQMDLVPTAQQRRIRRDRIRELRKDKPIMIYDFWNDGDAVDGCIAWGRVHVPITAKGRVEPCTFIHFANCRVNKGTRGKIWT